MSQFIYQLKQAWVSLQKKPGFVATVLTTMGITVGALLCILTLAYLLLLQPLPYPDQDSLFKVEHRIINQDGKENAEAFTYPGLVHLYKNQTVFSEAAMVNYNEDVLISHPSQPALPIAFITPEWFSFVDIPMALGRGFEATEATDTNNPVAVIDYHTWQVQFGADPKILDQKVNFSGVSFSIVGVISQSFVEPQIQQTGLQTRVWLPWDFNFNGPQQRESFGSIDGSLIFTGKLKDGMTATQAEQVITPLVNDRWTEGVTGIDFFKGWYLQMGMVSFKSMILGESEQTIYMLLAGVIGLVLIACANIANLFMSRTAEQQSQLAVHAAVGAKKSDLFRNLFAETGLLMALSIVVALIVALAGFEVLQQYMSNLLPRVNELSLNWMTFGIAGLIALSFAFFFARLSANMINYRAINQTLQSSGKGTGIQVSKRVRQLLIISQIAIVTTLVFVNISLFNDAVKTIKTPMGITVDNVSRVSLSLSSTTALTPEETAVMMREILEKFEQLPQVESANMGSSPLTGWGIWAMTAVESNKRYTPNGKGVDAKYFNMIGQTLLEGDNFTPADIKEGNDVMIINDVMAKELAPNGSALGLHFATGPDTHSKIIGVVKGLQLPGQVEVPRRVYVPTPPTFRFMIKLKPNQTISREQAVATLQEVTNSLTIFALESLEERRNQLLFTQFTTAITTAVLAVLSFFLAGIGLYGIFSYSIQLRRFELGTRMAIGAKRKDLIGLIIKDNSSPVVIGIILSVIILLALYLGFSDNLEAYVNSGLVVIYMVTLALITGASLSASYWPLRGIINRPTIYSLRSCD